VPQMSLQALPIIAGFRKTVDRPVRHECTDQPLAVISCFDDGGVDVAPADLAALQTERESITARLGLF